jgi:3-oxoacyl-[acyl-carrier protein] reductase
MTEFMGLDAELFAPENVAPLVGFLASPAAERISGQLFVVYGTFVGVVEQMSFAERFTSEARWNYEALDATLGPYFAKRQPVADGFAMPMQ